MACNHTLQGNGKREVKKVYDTLQCSTVLYVSSISYLQQNRKIIYKYSNTPVATSQNVMAVYGPLVITHMWCFIGACWDGPPNIPPLHTQASSPKPSKMPHNTRHLLSILCNTKCSPSMLENKNKKYLLFVHQKMRVVYKNSKANYFPLQYDDTE